MTFCNLLSKTTLGMLGASLLVLPAQAQNKPLERQPEGQWQVKSIESGQTGKRPYCVMVQPYRNGGKLTISSNHKRQTALAFDIGEALLDPSRDYSLALTPGHGKTYRYDVSPLSDSEFILRFGSDSAAFETIKTSPEIRVRVADQSLDIRLPNMGRVTRSLSDCVQRVVTSSKSSAPKQSKSVTDTAVARLRSENRELRQSLRQIRQKLENVRAKSGDSARAAELKEKVKTLEGKLAKARKETRKQAGHDTSRAEEEKLARLRQNLSEEKSARKSARERARKLEKKISSLEQLKNEQKEMEKKLESLRSKEAHLSEKLKKSRQNLSEEKSARKSARERARKLEKKLSSLQQEQQTQQVNDSRIAKLSKNNSRLRRQLAQLRKKLENAQSQPDKSGRLAELKERVKTLEGKLAKARQETEKQVGQGASRADEEEMARLREELSATKAARQKYEKQIEQLQQEKSRLKQRLDQQRRRKSTNSEDIASLRVENKSLKQKLDTARTKLDTAQNKLVRRSAEQCNFAKQDGPSQKRIEGLNSRLSGLQEQNSRLRSDLSAARSRLEDVLAGQENDNAGAGDGKGTLKMANRYHEAQREIRRLGGKLREKRQSCQQEVEDLEQMLFDPGLAESKQISVLNKLERQLKQARAKIRQLKSRENNLQTASASSAGATIPQPVQSEPVSKLENTADRQRGTQHKTDSKPLDLKTRRGNQQRTGETGKDSIEMIARDLNSGGKIYTKTRAVADLLSRAGLGSVSGLSPVNRTSDGVYAAYQWDQGPIYGSAKFGKIADKQSLSRVVDRYIAQTRSRCPADFSARPASVRMSGTNARNVSAYDIACVGTNVNNAASILFMRDVNNNFSVIAFEAETNEMSRTMRFRDAVLQTVATAKTAQR